MEEQFEKNIRNNSQDFDHLEVPEGTWENIKVLRSAPEPKRFTLRKFMQYAAGIVFISMTSIMIYSALQNEDQVAPSQMVEQNTVPPELEIIQASFIEQQASAEEEFNTEVPVNHEIYVEIQDQLSFLEEEKENLIHEFTQNYQDPKILEQITEIYRLKIEILEDAVSLINQ